MKKYVILLAGTLLAIGAIWAIGMVTQPTAVTVKTVTLTEQTVRQTVDCVGRVEAIDSHEVFAKMPCVAGEVYVAAGQTVQEGDRLFEVDMNATQAVISQMGATLPDGLDGSSYTVTASADGVLTELNVKTGDVVDPSVPCAVIAPGTGLQIAAVVREQDLRKVKVGQAVEISGVGFEKPLYHGAVAAMADTAHQQYIGTVNETVVDAVIRLGDGEADDSLRVGLGATVSIVVDTVEHAVLIPYTCIAQNDEGEEYVYVCADDGFARRRVVQIKTEYADGAMVVSGISANDRLVCDPERLSGDTVPVNEEG